MSKTCSLDCSPRLAVCKEDERIGSTSCLEGSAVEGDAADVSLQQQLTVGHAL